MPSGSLMFTIPTVLTVIAHWLSIVLLLGSQMFITVSFWPWLATAHGVDGFLRGIKAFRPIALLTVVLLIASGVQQLISLGGMKAMPTLFHIKLTLALVFVLSLLLQNLIVFPKWQKSPRSDSSAKVFWLLSLEMTVTGIAAIVCLALAKGY